MLLLNSNSVYAGNDGKVLSIDRVTGTQSIMNIFNATDLYTYQWLKYYIHLNTIFFKKRVLKTKFQKYQVICHILVKCKVNIQSQFFNLQDNKKHIEY